jgi:hypothetical protein
MFSELQGQWLDGVFFNILRYIDNMQGYFLEQARIVAMICFALSVGISCVKMAMGGGELNKELTKTFMGVVTYFILIWAFPLIMVGMNKIVGELAYGATMGQGINSSSAYDGKYGSADGFFEYMNKIGKDKDNNTLWAIRGTSGTPQKVFEFHITNTETGLISMNRVFQMILITFRAMWSSLNVKNLFDFFVHIGDVILVVMVALVYVWAIVMAIIQYAMTMIQFMFLYAVGVIFIPMSLWEGSKHAFESMVGGIFKIGIRLLIVMITLYLVVLGNVDILKNMYILSSGELDVVQRIEFYLTVFFMAMFFKLFVDQAPSIADFLSGGSPKLSFGEFAQAAASVGAGAVMAAKAGGGAMSAGAKGAAMAGSAVVAAGQNAGAAAAAEKGAGTGIMGQLGARTQGFATSLGKSAVQGAANVADKGIDALSNAPSAMKAGLKNMRYGLSPAGPLSAEGIGRAPGFSRSGGGGGSGGGNGSPDAKQQEADRLMQSKNMSDRMNGIGANYAALRSQGGQYSGLGGSFKALSSSIGKFQQSNRDAAPASFRMSDNLQRQNAMKEKNGPNAGGASE